MRGSNGYRSLAEEGGDGWRAVILDPEGREVFERPFPQEAAALAFVSTVEQHIGWLSESKFRRYYRLPDDEDEER